MNLQTFETEAMVTRARLIKRLRASAKITTTALASVLADCSDEAPCLDGACPLCGLKFQQAGVRLIEQAIAGPAQALRGRMSMLTIVPPCGIADPNGLTVVVVTRVIDEVKAALSAIDCPTSIFSVDTSFNDDLTGEVAPHWCVHAHGIIVDWLSDAQKAGLKGLFPPCEQVKQPVMVVPLDERPDAPSYVCKWQRERRQTYLDDSGRDGRRPHRATRSKLLRPAQAVDLALVDHRVGLVGRLFGHRVSDAVVKRHFEAFEPSIELD